MNAVTTLPDGYRAAGTIDVNRDKRLLVALNLAGFILLIVFGWVFFRALLWLRPEEALSSATSITIDSPKDMLAMAAAIIALTAVNLVLHEATHGIFFWWFTRARPEFAFRGAYAYAAAPEWYLARDAFFITTLAPLVLISLAGLLFFLTVPASWLMPVWLVLVLNSSGAVGDLMVAGWVLFQPADCLVNDRGDAVTVYRRNR